MTANVSGAATPLSRRIASLDGAIVRPLPDAELRALSAAARRDPTDLTPALPLGVHAGWYAEYWYGNRPERKPSVVLALLGRLGAAAVAAWQALRAGKPESDLAAGHPAEAR